MSVDRMPAPAQDAMTETQKAAAETFFKLRGVPVFGPYLPMMQSPDLLVRAQAVGEYLRYRSPLDPRLREFATLLTAREWSQDYEWAVHYPLALKAGLSAAIADAVRDGRRPEGMSEDETALYDFVAELNRSKRVCDATYNRAAQIFGKQGVIDLIAILGVYAWLAMTMNVAHITLPEGSEALPRFPD